MTSRVLRPLAMAALAAVVMATSPSGVDFAPELAAQNVQPKDLLPRVAAYIRTFVGSFQRLVAEESYKQEITSPHRKRLLKSDVMLVQFPGATGWLVFRDTFEVDGKSVRSEPERLTKLFVLPPENALQRAREITSASEKFNLAHIGTVNNPLLVFAMMQEENQDRFRFTMGGIEKSLGPDIRVMQFQEFRSPSLLKLDGSTDVFSSGIIWVEQATGRLVKTQFNLGKRGSGIEIQTTFRSDPDLKIDVPVLLKEWYPDGQGGDITGEATYSRFRQFQVAAQEDVKGFGK